MRRTYHSSEIIISSCLWRFWGHHPVYQIRGRSRPRTRARLVLSGLLILGLVNADRRLADVEEHKGLGDVAALDAELLADDAVPARPVLLVEVLLDRFPIEF